MLVGTAFASTDTLSRQALIIGVGQYADPEVAPLPGVMADLDSARQIARSMGIPESAITILQDAQATKPRIVEALQRMASTTEEGGRILLYFSGHGTRWTDPVRAECREGLLTHERDTLTHEEIAQHTQRLNPIIDKMIVMFDACHSEGVNAPRRGQTRSTQNRLIGKFSPRTGQQTDACSVASNMTRTRSLMAEATRLGALGENMVQISSSRADEVSFDEPGKGGIATQAIRDCLLGRAQDLDGSGAVSIREIEACAQGIVNAKIAPFADLKPHHITVLGNRNIVPARVRPPAGAPPVVSQTSGNTPPEPANLATSVAVVPVNAPPAPETAPSSLATPSPTPGAPPPAQASGPGATGPSSAGNDPIAAPVAASTPASPAAPAAPALPGASQSPAATPPSASPTQAVAPSAPWTPPPAAVASLATLKEIEQQSTPRRDLKVRLNRPELRIGRDPLELTLTSSHDGHVYLILLGSDRKSFYVLFPNELDQDNRIAARKPMHLPRPDWALKANGPPGVNHLLVMVTDSPRDLQTLKPAQASSTTPFTFTLTDLPGRAALLDMMIGRGITGRSESFGARLVSVRETR